MATQIFVAGTFATNINDDEETIVTYVTDNPGKTLAEIQAANTSISATTIQFIMTTWSEAGAAHLGSNATKEGVYYAASTWATSLYGQRQNARDWINGAGTF